MKRVLLVLLALLFSVSAVFAAEQKIYQKRVGSETYLRTDAGFDYDKKTGQAWVVVLIDEYSPSHYGYLSVTRDERVDVSGLHYDNKMIKYHGVVCAKVGFWGPKSTGNCKFRIEERDEIAVKETEVKDITVKLSVEQSKKQQ
jgi:hypothetical protein